MQLLEDLVAIATSLNNFCSCIFNIIFFKLVRSVHLTIHCRFVQAIINRNKPRLMEDTLVIVVDLS